MVIGQDMAQETHPKYVAIEEAYLNEGAVNLHVTRAGLKRALNALTRLKEMVVARHIRSQS
jgi:hypothetical protein